MATFVFSVGEDGEGRVTKSLGDVVQMFEKKPPQRFVEKPLKPGSDDKTISENIAELCDAGYAQDEAAAIALHNAGKTNADKGTPTVNSVHTPGPLGDETKKRAIVAKGRGRLLVVKGPPSPAELLRGEPFVGDERALLEKHLLEPIGLKRDDSILAWCEDPAEIDAFARAAAVDAVVSVSSLIRFEKRKDRWNLPELRSLARDESRFASEMARKRLALKSVLDNCRALPSCSLTVVSKGAKPTLGTNDTAPHVAPIKKANKAKQIVYGVVLDPYVVDAHNDWIPPADIENTAIEFMKRRVITLQHEEVAPDAQLVASFVEEYPTQSDYEKALSNEPHNAYARQYGQDRIHSGAWVIGVQLSDRLWKQFLDGEIGAFSIEGYGVRENVTMAAMPRVKFIELGEVGAVNGQEDPQARLA